jgi:EXLDI family protein
VILGLPIKTIYIKDEDMPIFERAVEIAGDNFSSIVSDAVREYVARKDLQGGGIKDIMLEIGTWQSDGKKDIKKITFQGEFLAEATDQSGGGITNWRIYRTKKGKYFIYRREQNDADTGCADYYVADSLPETGTIIKTEDDRRIEVPASLIQKAMERDTTPIERLDI